MTESPLPRRALRISLLGGAVYDLVLGCLILVQGGRIMDALGAPVTGFSFYFALASTPLFILPVLYSVAAFSDPMDGFRAPVLWARGGGGLFIVLLVILHRPGAAWVFVLIGLADLGWAVLHASLWRSLPEGSWSPSGPGARSG
jgi:hypothetical protein